MTRLWTYVQHHNTTHIHTHHTANTHVKAHRQWQLHKHISSDFCQHIPQSVIASVRSAYMATRPTPFTRLDATILLPTSDPNVWRRGSYNPYETAYPARYVTHKSHATQLNTDNTRETQWHRTYTIDIAEPACTVTYTRHYYILSPPHSLLFMSVSLTLTVAWSWRTCWLLSSGAKITEWTMTALIGTITFFLQLQQRRQQ